MEEERPPPPLSFFLPLLLKIVFSFIDLFSSYSASQSIGFDDVIKLGNQNDALIKKIKKVRAKLKEFHELKILVLLVQRECCAFLLHRAHTHTHPNKSNKSSNANKCKQIMTAIR